MFQRLCDDYQCLILVFFVIYRLMGIYQVGAPSRYLKSFVLSFLFFLFLFFFLFYSSFFCLSLGGPFSSGAPGHCPPMPPSRYATGGQEFYFPHSFLNFDQFFIFFFTLYLFSSSFWPSGWATRPLGKALAKPLVCFKT